MCFAADSRPPAPPLPPIRGASVDHELGTLEAADGNRFAALFARSDVRPHQAAVIVLPDVRGLYPFYEELALRFAEQGHDAVAIDYFGRTAGIGERADDFPYMDHVRQTTFEGVKADVAAAVAHLRAVDATRPIFTVGFCFGGSNSWHQAANGHGLAGAVGFYGHPTRPDMPRGAPPVIERVDEMEGKILALMGGADPAIPLEDVRAFDAALERAGVPHEVVIYEGAPHSFFDRKYDEYAEASADAWRRVLEFIA